MNAKTDFIYQIFKLENSPIGQEFLENLPQYFPHNGTIIHHARNQIRVMDMNGKKINVKKYCIPPIVNRILYSIGLRRPKAKSTYVNAQEIIKRGFATPQPYAYILERKKGLLYHSYFISEQVEGVKTIRHNSSDKKMISALAEYTAQLHEKGLMHKDFTPGNILYKEENGKYHFVLVDINRFHCKNKPIGLGGVCKNLMQPFNDDELIKFFVFEYAKYRKINTSIVWPYVYLLRHYRNFYDRTKRALKSLPGAKLLINKPINTKHK